MSTSSLPITEHGQLRCAHRGIAPEQLDLVVRHGRCFHAAGMTFFFFGKREMRRWRELLGELTQRLSGLVVVVSPNGSVVTVYRNSDAPRHIKKKSRWAWAEARPDRRFSNLL